MHLLLRTFLLIASIGFGSRLSVAAVAWNESVNGDLSGDRLNPTFLTFTAGSNTVSATTGTGGELDYFTFTLPAGMSVTALTLTSYSNPNGDNTAFIGVQSGSTFTVTPATAQASDLLGYTHFGPAPGNVGTNILDDIGAGPGSQGFTPPLGPGSYTFWLQQASGTPTTYQLDFTAIPEPGTVAFISGLSALTVAGVVRRVRGQRKQPGVSS